MAAIVYGCSRAGRVQTAFDIYNTCLEHGYLEAVPDPRTISLLINSCAQVGDVQGAEQCWERAQARGLKPSEC